MFFGNKLGRNWSAVAFVFVMLLALCGALIVGYQQSMTGYAVSSVGSASVYSEMLGLLILLLILGGIMTTVITAALRRFSGLKKETSFDRRSSFASSRPSFSFRSGSSYHRSLDDLAKINARLDDLNRDLKDVDRKL
jgi:hypothetical protein